MTTSIRKPGQSRTGIPIPPKVPGAMEPDEAIQPLIDPIDALDGASPRHAAKPGEDPSREPGTAPRAGLDAPTSTTVSETSSAKAAVDETSMTTVTASAAASTIRGDANDNELGSSDSTTPVIIYGAEGYDTLWGGTAADELYGDVDNDSLIGGAGNDTLDGGADWDTVFYQEETGGAGVVLNLSDSAWTYGDTVYESLTGTDTWGDLDTLLNFEMVYGSMSGDVIYAAGSMQGWYIYGNEGDDTLTGGGVDDTLVGGAGNDTLVNGTVVYIGSEAINANLATGHASGQGEDTLTNITRFIGGEGNDTIYGGKSASTIDGSLGNDVLYVGSSTTVLATMGNDTVHGGMGQNGIFSQPSRNRITGNGSTTLTYEDLSPTYGAIKADLGNGWVDEYYNGVRNATDTIFQIRSLIGSNGNDTIFGSAHNNTIVGGGGNDNIAGFGGSDSLAGGDGNDTLEGSSGYVDTLVGGLGDDYYSIGLDSLDVLVDAGGNDTIETYISTYTLKAGFENLVNKVSSEGTLTGNGLDNKLTSGNGNDTLDGAGGNDTMTGGNGNDTYYIRDLGDLAIELNGTTGGTDTVIISVRNYDGTKLANIENIQFVGEGSIAGNNTAPEIGGLASPVNLTIADNEVVSPFTSITIADADSASVTATVTLNNGYGTLMNLGSGSYDAQLRRYTVTGTVEQVQNALQNLVYDPTDRPTDAAGNTLTTAFTITLTDAEGAAATPNTNVSLTSVTANRAPTISFTPQTVTIADTENTDLVSPFTLLAINELNANDVLAVTIQLDAAEKGALVPVQGGTYDAATGTFTFIGTLQQARTAVAALLFNPTDRPLAESGSIETTTFSITVTDASGATASASDIATVHSVATGYENHAPTAPVLSNGDISDKATAGMVVGELTSTDQDGDAPTYTFSEALADSNGLISADGRFQVIENMIVVRDPTLIQVSQDSTFTYSVIASDGHGGQTSGSVSIVVADINKAPTDLQLSNSFVEENLAEGQVIGLVSASDPNGTALSYTLLDDAGGSVELVNNQLRVKDWTKFDYEQNAQFTVTVAVSDGLETVNRIFTITLENQRRENVVGNTGDNVIRGGVGSDTLNGAVGNDTLHGGEGRDLLTGGAGADAFAFDTAVMKTTIDTILDFSVAEGDRIYLSHKIFSGFGLGQLDASAFVIGTEAQDQGDRIIYDQSTGQLFYDLDGTGGATRDIRPVLFATFNPDGVKPALTYASFYII